MNIFSRTPIPKGLLSFSLVLALIATAIAVAPVESLGATASRLVSQVASRLAAVTSVGQPASQTALAAPEAYEQAVVSAVDRSMMAVVSVVATKDVPVLGRCTTVRGNVRYTVPCEKGTQSKQVGGGSGFFVSADGLVLTNEHVIDDEDATYSVFTTDGKTYQATVVGTDPIEDLAVLRVQGGGGFPVLQFANSDDLKLGQTAIAIGNALNEFRNTVSVGVISGLSRNVTASDRAGASESLANVIQTDAAINPGNSGGPLLNLQGQVVGINTAVVSNAEGIGFAIPANRASRLVDAAKRGVPAVAPYLGIRYSLSPDGGVVLAADRTGPAVEPDSPADLAGLREGDRITAMSGKPIRKIEDILNLVSTFDIGGQVVLTVIRNGVQQYIVVTVGSRT
jgi:serine protease Do